MLIRARDIEINALIKSKEMKMSWGEAHSILNEKQVPLHLLDCYIVSAPPNAQTAKLLWIIGNMN